MGPDAIAFLFGADVAPRVELALRLPDGRPWSLTFSPGIERFIGHYPRLEGFNCRGPLLEYARIGPAAPTSRPA
jgi:hypothetical protein